MKALVIGAVDWNVLRERVEDIGFVRSGVVSQKSKYIHYSDNNYSDSVLSLKLVLLCLQSVIDIYVQLFTPSMYDIAKDDSSTQLSSSL